MEMTEHEIKAKIAYIYYKKFKKLKKAEDRERDWALACLVWNHFQEKINPTNARWLAQRDDYQEFMGFF
jgi:hypothetical protein